MDAIKACRLHADDNVFELRVRLEDINDHAFQKLCTFLGIRNRFHFDEELLIEI